MHYSKFIDPIDIDDWDNLVLSNECYSFFHSVAWARVLSESYGYKPLYFTSYHKDRLSCLIPLMEIKTFITAKRAVSLPFTDYAEPILANGRGFQDSFGQIIAYGKKAGWKYVELRGVKTLASDTPPSKHYYTHALELSENEDEMFGKLRSSTKRNVKKAIKEGVDVKRSCSLDSIQEFYRLNCITRKKHGLPPQPYHFFKIVFDHIISRNQGIIVLASYNKQIIAANIYFHFGKKAIYKYGASDSHYQNLRANNLIMWEAIKWYCQNGYNNFCFGRTEPENNGLLQFKSGWGAEQMILKYYKYDLRKANFVADDQQKARHFYSIFSKMPIPLLRLIGKVLYPYMG